MKVLTFVSDLSGCYIYRVKIPFQELRRFGVKNTCLPELPNNPWGSDFQALAEFISNYDLVKIQRCYKHHIVARIKNACELVGKPMVFETDDDYLHLPPYNPCYPEIAKPGALQEYIQVISMADLVTVSTEELRDVLYPYNRNIVTLPNNMEQIYCGEVGSPKRAYIKEIPDENGKLQIPNYHGIISVPSFWDAQDKKNPEKIYRNRTIRIGYTGTPTHRQDFETIRRGLEKVMEKYGKKVWLIFVGDPYFFEVMEKGKSRIIHIPISQYELYMYHIRNIDIGIAPLFPDVFNESKSPLKAMEYASWGIPSVLPNYVTYNREFTAGKNCLMYYNQQEFVDCLSELIENDSLREKLGVAARDHVRDHRLERDYALKRFTLYSDLIRRSPKFSQFVPSRVRDSNAA